MQTEAEDDLELYAAAAAIEESLERPEKKKVRSVTIDYKTLLHYQLEALKKINKLGSWAEALKHVLETVGPLEILPSYIRELFKTQDLTYSKRFSLVLFAFANGVDPVLLYQFCQHKGVFRPGKEQRLKEMESIWRDCIAGKHDNKYTYSVSDRFWIFINGRPHYQKNKKERIVCHYDK